MGPGGTEMAQLRTSPSAWSCYIYLSLASPETSTIGMKVLRPEDG